MGTGENLFTAGLVFMTSKNCDTLELSASMQRVLEANGHRICGVQVLSDNHVMVMSDTLTLDLSVPRNDIHAKSHQMNADTHSSRDILNNAALIIEIALTQPADTIGVPVKRNIQATLANLTCQLAIWLDPDYVRWLSEDTLLDTSDFVKAVARVMPRRVKRKDQAEAQRPARPVLATQLGQSQHTEEMQSAMSSDTPIRPARPVRSADRPHSSRGSARFPDVDSTSRQLDTEFDRLNRQSIEKKQAEMHELSELRTTLHHEMDDEALEELGIASPRNSVARMATWFVAITVGVFSLPVAAFLIVYNLFRGEDFRLAAHALSLTGLFTALSARGATADVVHFVAQIVN